MTGFEDYNATTPTEWGVVWGFAGLLVLLGVALGVSGLVPLKQGVALGVTLFMVGFLAHIYWRYRPLNQASRLLDEGNFPAARFVLESYLRTPVHRGGKARHKALLLYAHALWYLEEGEAAIQHAETLLEETEDHTLWVLAHYLLVACNIQLRKSLKVHQSYGKLMKLDGLTAEERRESQIAIGVCAMNEEMFHDAIDFFLQARDSCEDGERKAYVFGLLAACYNRVKDYVKALGAVQDARKIKERSPLVEAMILDNFAFAKANLKQDLDEALGAADKGLSLGLPAATPHLHTSRGEVHYARRDFDAALADLEEAIRTLPERDKNARQKAWFIKGKIHKARGEDDKAREALSEAISIDSSRTIANNAQAVLASPEALNTLIQSGDVQLKPPEE